MANIKKYPDQIRTLINEIEKNNTLPNEALVRILKEQDLAADDFIDFADFIHSPELSYGRTKLYQGLNFVIYLMSWVEGDFTAIHNHGQSDWGAVSFLGNINHRLYTNESGALKLADKSIIPIGTIVPVKGDLIHAMGNLTQKPCLTLHIYGSDRNLSLPNTTSHIYELEKKRVRITLGEAYIDGFQNIADPIETVVTNEDSLIDYLKIILPFYQKNHKTEMVNYIKSVLNNPAIYFGKKFDFVSREKNSFSI